MKSTIFLIALLTVAALPLTGQAGTYVSLTGDFYFEYPSEWMQVDNRVVDAHLLANQAGKSTLEYEAAFSPVSSVPFFSGAYFIMTVDTTGGAFTQAEIDSTLRDMSQKFGTDIRYFPVADLLADMKSNSPSYDAQTKTITVVSDITERGEVIKKLLLAVRFHDKGLATFYFYAPVAAFGEALPIFNGVLASFHAGDAEQMLPKETLKVADIETGAPAEAGKRRPYMFWGGGVVIVLIVAMVLRRRRRQNR